MAGNIIPAIATTNAITAGIVVMRSFKVLQEQYDQCQSVYVRLTMNPRNQIFVPDRSKFIWYRRFSFHQLIKTIFFCFCSFDGTKSKMYCVFSQTTGGH